jgi:hypothetical protein
VFAPRHLVFCGPGELPAELRAGLPRVAAHRDPGPEPSPRLLGVFDRAADAERAAAALQAHRIDALVAGPEQPPAQEGWASARTLEPFAGRWRVATAEGVTAELQLQRLQAVTVIDWRPADGVADRAVLLRPSGGERPTFIRASAIDEVSPLATPGRGLERIAALLDDAARAAPRELRVRQRTLSPTALGVELPGTDLLPLAVAVVDALDVEPRALPRPLGGRAEPGPGTRTEAPALAGAVAWALYAGAIALGPVCLLLLGAGAMLGSLASVIAGVLAGAIGSRRLGWAQWLAEARWANTSRLPRWPRGRDEPASAPRVGDLVLDASLVAAVLWGTVNPSPAALLHAVLVLPAVAVAGLSSLAVWLRSSADE